MNRFVLLSIFSILSILSSLIFFAFNSTYANVEYHPDPILVTRSPITPLPEFFEQFVQDSMCDLPCWFGWVLGTDTLAGVLAKIEDNLGQEETVSLTKDHYSVISVEFPRVTSEIQRADANGFALWIDNSEDTLVAIETFVDLSIPWTVEWTPYMPNGIFKQYGVPENVTLSIQKPTEHTTGWYSLILRYPSQGLYVEYLGDLAEESDHLEVCPTGSIFFFRFWVQTGPILEEVSFWEDLTIEHENDQDIIDLTNEDVEAILTKGSRCFIITE